MANKCELCQKTCDISCEDYKNGRMIGNVWDNRKVFIPTPIEHCQSKDYMENGSEYEWVDLGNGWKRRVRVQKPRRNDEEYGSLLSDDYFKRHG